MGTATPDASAGLAEGGILVVAGRPGHTPAVPVRGAPSPGKGEQVGSRRLVLVVDDEPWVGKLIAAALDDQGFDIESAT